jgi:hypothetical protein
VLKINFSIKYCIDNGFTYKIRDIGCLTKEEIKNLYYTQLIKFTNKYELKFKEYETIKN